jgi:hypothetical protein
MSTDDITMTLNVNKNDICEDMETNAVNNEQKGKESANKEQKGKESARRISTNKTPTKLSKSIMDTTRSNIFYSDIEMPKDFLSDIPKECQFQYKVMKGTLEQIVEEIKVDIRDIKPKNLILHCFGKTLHQRTNQSVIDYVYELVDMVDNEGIHNIAPSTNHFIPNKPRTWTHVANFNCQMRMVNIDRGQPPLTLHKCLMDREHGDHGQLLCNGKMWVEYCQGEGLGDNLSRTGLGKYKQFILKAFKYQFQQQHEPSSRNIGTPKPPPLAVTPGYEDNPQMRKFMEEKGILDITGIYNRASPKQKDEPTKQKGEPTKQKQRSASAKQSESTDKETNNETNKNKLSPFSPRIKLKSSSVASLDRLDLDDEPSVKPRWYAENIKVTEAQGAKRKVSLQSTSSENDLTEKGNFNEDELQDQIVNQMYKQLRRKHATYEDLERSLDKLQELKRNDEKYYLKKIDNLYLEVEQLKDALGRMVTAKETFKIEYDNFSKEAEQWKKENDEYKHAEEDYKINLRSAQRKIDAKDEEIKFKDERIAMIDRQCEFFRSMHNDIGDLLFEKQEKSDKKKKRK